jgi:hypothetical protein
MSIILPSSTRGRILEEGIRKLAQRSRLHQQEGRREALILPGLIVAMKAALGKRQLNAAAEGY